MATTALEVVKREQGTNPWLISIAEGPSAGLFVCGGFPRKRDAVAHMETIAHLPWHQATGIASVSAEGDVLATVPTMEIVRLQERLAAAEKEAAIYKRVCLFIDLHSDVKQSDLRAALKQADSDYGSLADDPWKVVASDD